MKEIFKKLYSKDIDEYFKFLENKLIKEKKLFIVTANPETFMLVQKDQEMSEILNDKNISIVPDGIGVVKAAHILNIDIKERITGVDIAVKLLEFCNKLGKSLYLFGAKEEVITAMKSVIKAKYPNVKLIGVTNGYVKDKDKVMDEIVSLKPDVVMVALGIPAQEKLIYKHLDKFEKGIFIGVGGSFDVISGSKKRAPKIFIKTNTEWLYRILSEPKRIKRFFNSNVKFLFKVFRIKNEKSKR